MPTIWHKNAAYCNHGDLMNTAENTIWALEQRYSIETHKDTLQDHLNDPID
jgi:hypothetical protein